MASRETLLAIWKDLAIEGGIKNDALDQISINIEFRLRRLIEEATSVMRHSRRCTLTPNDIEIGLKNIGSQPLIGFVPKSSDYGLMRRGRTGLLVEERPIDLRDLSNSELPPPVEEQKISVSWMMVDAEQPATEENGKGFGPDVPESVRGVWRTVPSGGGDVKKVGESSTDGGVLQASLSLLLSKEQKLFLDCVKSAYRSILVDSQRVMHPKTALILRALRHGGGLGQLVPFLTKYFSEQILLNSSTTPIPALRVALSALHDLTCNRLVNIAPYLHQILHPLLFLAIGPRASNSSNEEASIFLRCLAARAAADAAIRSCAVGPQLTSVPSLILAAFAETAEASLDTVSPGEFIGALEGILALGPAAVRTIASKLLRTTLLFLSQSTEEIENYHNPEDAAEAKFARLAANTRARASSDGSVSVDAIKKASALLANPTMPSFHTLQTLSGSAVGLSAELVNRGDNASEIDARERLVSAVLEMRLERDRRCFLRAKICDLVLRIVLLAASMPSSRDSRGGVSALTAAFPAPAALPIKLLTHVRTMLGERVVLLSHAATSSVLGGVLDSASEVVSRRSILKHTQQNQNTKKPSWGFKSDDKDDFVQLPVKAALSSEYLTSLKLKSPAAYEMLTRNTTNDALSQDTNRVISHHFLHNVV